MKNKPLIQKQSNQSTGKNVSQNIFRRKKPAKNEEEKKSITSSKNIKNNYSASSAMPSFKADGLSADNKSN